LSLELMHESQRIFLVTTPEVAPVYLAKARVRSLKEQGLADRVSLVLNRKDHWRGHLAPDAVAEAVGIPVAYCIGNDYGTISEAILNGSSVPGASDIGRSIVNLAQSLRADLQKKTIPAVHERKFLEFFHVSQAEDPTTVWHG
jgi:Flp pilus assembly CpaE family ATPase